MKTSTMAGIGVAAIAAIVLLRRSGAASQVTLQTAAGPVSVPVPSYARSQVASAMASGRDAMIQQIMAHDHVTREVAAARYDQLAPTIGAALTRGTSGLGNYYRST
jgi:hypothetical protein